MTTPTMFWQTILLALSILAPVLSVAHVNLTQIFGPYVSSATKILVPSDVNFTEEVPGRWTIWEQPTFFGVIQPATETDVQKIVQIATTHGIPFLAIATGHGFAVDFSKYKDALEIDLDSLNSIVVDATNNLMTIGGSVTFGEIIPALFAAGKEIPTGNAACVGMVGVTVGAGIGTLQGLHGLIIDSLVSARMVTASGDLITVSETQHADLFWALRGAGANFGVITSATYNIYDATNGGQVVNADFLFPPSANRSVFEFLQSLDESIPAPLSLQITLSYDQTTKQPSILTNVIYFGPQSEVQPYLNRLLALNPTTSNITTVPWTQIEAAQYFGQAAAGSCTNGSYDNIYSIGLNQTNVSTFETYFSDLAVFAAGHPTYTGGVNIQRYPTGKTLSIPANGSVCPWRDIKTHLLFGNTYPDSSLDSAVDTFMRLARSRFQATSGFEELQVYINYAHGDEGPAVWYGEWNLPRLEVLKEKWDPKNWFTGGHPIVRL